MERYRFLLRKFDMTFIVGVSGKKQSGKNTVCKYLSKMIQLKASRTCKIYSFADALKEKVCIDVMGLSKEQCYGTDEQKNTLTGYRWENLPQEIKYNNKLGCNYASNGEVCEYIKPKGLMLKGFETSKVKKPPPVVT